MQEVHVNNSYKTTQLTLNTSTGTHQIFVPKWPSMPANMVHERPVTTSPGSWGRKSANRQSTPSSWRISRQSRRWRTETHPTMTSPNFHLRNGAAPFSLGRILMHRYSCTCGRFGKGGGVVTASVVVAATRGILISRDRTQLAEFGGHIQLSRQWAYHLLSRMKFMKRKATTAKSKHTPADFAAAKEAFFGRRRWCRPDG